MAIEIHKTLISFFIGSLRPITPTYLCRVLELILNALVSSSLSHKSAPVEEVISALADEHEVPRQVSTQIMVWFGEIHEGKWRMNADGVVKEIGLGILRNHKVIPSVACLIAAYSRLLSRTIPSQKKTS